jgi:hypothetical protein
MAENLITIGMILVAFPVLAVILSDTFENGCVEISIAQVIVGIVLIIVGIGAMLGGE